MDLENPPD